MYILGRDCEQKIFYWFPFFIERPYNKSQKEEKLACAALFSSVFFLLSKEREKIFPINLMHLPK